MLATSTISGSAGILWNDDSILLLIDLHRSVQRWLEKQEYTSAFHSFCWPSCMWFKSLFNFLTIILSAHGSDISNMDNHGHFP